MNKLHKLITGVLVLCLLVASCCFNVFALGNGTYTMDTVTHYVNPDTGKTDDGGTANIELGEGMCRSAVYEKATVEKNDNCAEITMRMLLYSNLSNIRFSVQESPKGSYTDVQYSIVKESASSDSADIKFTAPSADSIVRVKMYVKPMGRDVCFYWNCDESTAVASNANIEQENKTKVEDETDKFTDIIGHWAEKDIVTVVEKGLFSGTSETTFDPEASMTRGMFVTVLGRMSGEDISGTSIFADVDNNKYYSKYIAWANKNGIVSGTSETTFNPDSPVTCEQAAVILSKYADYKWIEFEAKSISPSTTGVSEWAKDSVIKTGKAGIITKQNTNGYNYTSSATRADVASMLCNFAEYYGN
jgi:hypothetical protein